jgi:indolepyruvate decarboxylase
MVKTASDMMELGKFLFSYLRDRGITHCFGIPGDYILSLFKALEETPGIKAVVPTHEPAAAFSADAYGRITGLGVLLVTYGVGGFNAMNGVACAHAESSPLLVISGGPPTRMSKNGDPFAPAAHHYVKHLSSQQEAYRHVTDMDLRIESLETAADIIVKAVTHAVEKKRPVYLEIPTDLMSLEIPVKKKIDDKISERLNANGDIEVLERATSYFVNRIEESQNPVIVAGVEIGRYALQDEILHIMEAGHIPVATSILGKGIFDESKPGILGVYAGVISQSPEIRKIVEESDLVVLLGVKVTDVNCGAFTADLKRENILIAKSGWVGDGYMRFSEDIPFDRFITRLSQKVTTFDHAKRWPDIPKQDLKTSPVLMDRYLAVINDALENNHIVIADTGDSCYGSLFMNTRRRNGYMAPTFYNTMGFAVPAALGVQLADTDHSCRPIVLVGDGAFQMTGLELSTLVKWGLNPIVIIFNNSGYGMQRIFVDGPFNDIKGWDYTRIVDLVGGGKAWKVTTAEEMQKALREAKEYFTGPSLIEAIVPKGELSTGLKTFGKTILREKRGICPLNQENKPCSHQHHCAFCRATIWK